MCFKTIPVSRVIYILQTIDILLTHSCLRCSECQLIQHHNYPRVQSQWELTLNPRWRCTRTVNKQKNTIISASRNSSNDIDDGMTSPAKWLQTDWPWFAGLNDTRSGDYFEKSVFLRGQTSWWNHRDLSDQSAGSRPDFPGPDPSHEPRYLVERGVYACQSIPEAPLLLGDRKRSTNERFLCRSGPVDWVA